MSNAFRVASVGRVVWSCMFLVFLAGPLLAFCFSLLGPLFWGFLAAESGVQEETRTHAPKERGPSFFARLREPMEGIPHPLPAHLSLCPQRLDARTGRDLAPKGDAVVGDGGIDDDPCEWI